MFTGGAAAGAGAAAAGAAGAGLTIGQALSTAGTLIGIGGSLYQASSSAAAARTQARYLEQQSATERQLSVIEDQRTRERMRGALARQRAELAGRGVSLDSPTAVLLGRRAAEELSFASQSVRSGAAARQVEIGAERRGFLARSSQAWLTGGFSAAATALDAAPKIWPGLSGRRVLT